MASIRDVAKRAGVGVGTVSRVLNNSGYVAADTKGKIEKAMKELDYTPNELARNLFQKRSGIIAVLVPDIAHPVFAELVRCIEKELYKIGFKTMVCSTVGEQNYESEYLDMLKRHIVDGVITGVHSLDIDEYLNTDLPIVSFDRFLGSDIPVVSANHWNGGLLAAEEMIRAGATSVVHFYGAKIVNSPSRDRHDSFEQKMKEAGIDVFSCELSWNRFEAVYFNNVVREVFYRHPEANGVFGTDLLAMAYMKIAMEEGKEVPGDLKVIAYDGTMPTTISYPTLTAIVQPFDKLAKECTRLLMKRIDGIDIENKRVIVEVSLRKGKTT